MTINPLFVLNPSCPPLAGAYGVDWTSSPHQLPLHYEYEFSSRILFSHKGTKITKKMIESRKISSTFCLCGLCVFVWIFSFLFVSCVGWVKRSEPIIPFKDFYWWVRCRFTHPTHLNKLMDIQTINLPKLLLMPVHPLHPPLAGDSGLPHLR